MYIIIDVAKILRTRHDLELVFARFERKVPTGDSWVLERAVGGLGVGKHSNVFLMRAGDLAALTISRRSL